MLYPLSYEGGTSARTSAIVPRVNRPSAYALCVLGSFATPFGAHLRRFFESPSGCTPP